MSTRSKSLHRGPAPRPHCSWGLPVSYCATLTLHRGPAPRPHCSETGDENLLPYVAFTADQLRGPIAAAESVPGERSGRTRTAEHLRVPIHALARLKRFIAVRPVHCRWLVVDLCPVRSWEV